VTELNGAASPSMVVRLCKDVWMQHHQRTAAGNVK